MYKESWQDVWVQYYKCLPTENVTHILCAIDLLSVWTNRSANIKSLLLPDNMEHVEQTSFF